ncbi:anthranilate phosphoribosyltransferase [Anaeromyxobacter sp. K]|uniref:Anthranilate phosphoribosyltransferase n=1 Tax=Anaeromyxobacter sp. (strain K) TaxID=447217 RepID=TRPD_ANASK|nr:anthranilate phosphoribosyltransferase [Anaeromyxobacter sp. K]B4UHD1.1 RecName: Full=Anthranilate phosphoribosyltransferase [Anaeromyxobacter sp. K]ACG75373.1 anthranilate phosphoribosyltransferase [Anaeromyxobacter sp. K]
MIQQAIAKVLEGEDLTRAEAASVMTEIADGGATPAQSGAFLAALRMKGETVDEIAGAADVMRQRADRVRVDRDVFIDTCGTGGDGRHTFNISTTAAFVAAGAGVCVAKHGNRAVSSRSGSADVLAALGVNVDADKETVERCIEEVGIGFLFAVRLHPAFKAIAGVRRELGVRTIFNLLGPLANPAGARHQVLGVYEARWVPVLGGVLAALGAAHAFVVHGEGLDEIAVTGMTHVCEVRDGQVERYTIRPEDLGLPRRDAAELVGGDAAANARIVTDVLEGQAGGPRDAVLANAAAALVCAGAAKDLRDGVARAARSIDSGAAREKLRQLVAATTVPA